MIWGLYNTGVNRNISPSAWVTAFHQTCVHALNIYLTLTLQLLPGGIGMREGAWGVSGMRYVTIEVKLLLQYSATFSCLPCHNKASLFASILWMYFPEFTCNWCHWDELENIFLVLLFPQLDQIHQIMLFSNIQSIFATADYSAQFWRAERSEVECWMSLAS